MNLSWTDLERAKLADTTMIGTNLQGANLRNADLAGADLREADLGGADLRGASLNGAVFEETQYDMLTQWPLGFDPFVAAGLVSKERM